MSCYYALCTVTTHSKSDNISTSNNKTFENSLVNDADKSNYSGHHNVPQKKFLLMIYLNDGNTKRKNLKV